jgi:hypothetical protein
MTLKCSFSNARNNGQIWWIGAGEKMTCAGKLNDFDQLFRYPMKQKNAHPLGGTCVFRHSGNEYIVRLGS